MLVIQTDYSTPAAALGRRAHSHREALSLVKLFLSIRLGRATALTETRSLDAHQYTHGEWWSPCVYCYNIEGIMTINLR